MFFFKKMELFLVISFLVVTSLQAENLGHRLGGDIYKPENTLYSYQKALDNLINKKNFKYVEFDVRETKDNKLVVFHDSFIKRIVPKTKYNLTILKRVLKKKPFEEIRIRDLTLNEISKITLDHDAKIPTLKEVLEFSLQKRLQKSIHIEIKYLHSDKARNELIKTTSFYNKYLDISFYTFNRNFYKSFPLTDRWVKKFKENDFKIYKLDKAEYRQKYSLTNNYDYLTLLDETFFKITNKKNRTNRFLFSIPKKLSYNATIKIGIYHGFDDSGDGGVEFVLKDKNNRIFATGFSNSKNWEWFEIPNINSRELILLIKDYDTTLVGKNAGNKGKVKVLLEVK